ncbi:MAG: hypothetical protein KC486_29445, partial [Myxococcales bacterium]|nr:hypothetical protein [Myxococcales bacterium]
MSPERLAAAVRARHDELLELVALRSEAMAAALEGELGMVAWDRQVVIGRAQRGLRRLADEAPRLSKAASGGVRVIERARQPLESLPAVWGALLRGSRVHVEFEPGASTAVAEVLRPLGERLGVGGARPLTVAAAARERGEEVDGDEPGVPDEPPEGVVDWPQIGVELAHERVGVVGV